MGMRRKARELVLQAAYALEMSGSPPEEIANTLFHALAKDGDAFGFAKTLFNKTLEEKEKLDQQIAMALENWNWSRLAVLDRLILRQALCELLYFEEIPPKVTINEAIELAKKFSTEESGHFVNGILDALYKKYQQENRIVKRGRGLLG